uniref:Aa_trans domain-containing protein n=1 Tax=Rodentolepis nana TaxID=102285 RepID=A0A0R3T435_RODNA
LRLDFFVCGFLAQCTLADSLSMSTEFGTVVGITGPVWYAIAAQMPVILFTIMLIRFRMIAPGARTFLHVVNARFGRTAHILLCVLSLSNNISFVVRVIGMGNKIFTAISSGVTFNLVWIVNITIAAIFVGCAKLRQAFLVSAFGAVFILISTLVFFVGCAQRINWHNFKISLLSYHMFRFSVNTYIFMDQSVWQSCSYAEPGEESLGVMISSILWMAIPYAFGTACSAGFISLVSQKELNEMTPNEIAGKWLAIFKVAKSISITENLVVKVSDFSNSIGSILTTTLGPLVYTFFWDGMTSNGIVIGTLLSTSIIAFMWHMLNLLEIIKVGKDLSDVILYAIAIILGFVLPPLVVFIEKMWKRIHGKTWLSPLHSSWARVYEMDNPLDPCAFDYAKSFSLANFDMQSYNRPSFQEVKRAYRFSWYFALAGPFLFCFFFVGVMPMMFSIVNSMDLVTFKAWVSYTNRPVINQITHGGVSSV